MQLNEDPADTTDIKVVPYNQSKAMDEARYSLAKRLFWLLVAVLAGGTVLIAAAEIFGGDVQGVKDLFLTVFTSILAIVSSVVGYYYGSKGNEKGG